jgi:hypothetical protein
MEAAPGNDTYGTFCDDGTNKEMETIEMHTRYATQLTAEGAMCI